MTEGIFMTFPYFFASLVSTTARNWDERHGIAEAAQFKFKHFDCPLVSFSEFDLKGTLCITALCLCPQLLSLGIRMRHGISVAGHESFASCQDGSSGFRTTDKAKPWRERLQTSPRKHEKVILELTGAHWSWVLCILYLVN